MKYDIHIIGAEVYYLPVHMRLPMKFEAETVDYVTCARARIKVAGFSFLPLLKGEKQPSRDKVFTNLVGESDYKSDLKKKQGRLHDWMKQTDDPLLPAFENRNSPEKLKSTLIDIYGDNYVKAAQGRKNISKGNKKTRKNRNR